LITNCIGTVYVQKIRLFYSHRSDIVVFHLCVSLVRFEGSGTGDIHGDMDSVNFYLWNLLQAVRIDEQEKMSFDLIYPAIVIFSLLVVGLVLTVMEFKNLSEPKEDKRQR